VHVEREGSGFSSAVGLYFCEFSTSKAKDHLCTYSLTWALSVNIIHRNYPPSRCHVRQVSPIAPNTWLSIIPHPFFFRPSGKKTPLRRYWKVHILHVYRQSFGYF